MVSDAEHCALLTPQQQLSAQNPPTTPIKVKSGMTMKQEVTYIIEFSAIERGLVILPCDNCINYNAGPIRFELLTQYNTIRIYTTLEWINLLPDLLEKTKGIWKYKDSNLKKINDVEYHVTYDIKILNRYLEYLILF